VIVDNSSKIWYNNKIENCNGDFVMSSGEVKEVDKKK